MEKTEISDEMFELMVRIEEFVNEQAVRAGHDLHEVWQTVAEMAVDNANGEGDFDDTEQ